MSRSPTPADPVHRLAAAEARATAARGKLMHTVSIIQARLDPGRLAAEAKRGMGGAGAVAAERGLDTARRYPGALAGVTALAGLFLARHRVAELFRRHPHAETSAKPARLPDLHQKD